MKRTVWVYCIQTRFRPDGYVRWGFLFSYIAYERGVFYASDRKKQTENSLHYGHGNAFCIVGGADDGELQRSVYAVLY